MIEHKLPEGMTLPESKACMTEHKLPLEHDEHTVIDRNEATIGLNAIDYWKLVNG